MRVVVWHMAGIARGLLLHVTTTGSELVRGVFDSIRSFICMVDSRLVPSEFSRPSTAIWCYDIIQFK